MRQKKQGSLQDLPGDGSGASLVPLAACGAVSGLHAMDLGLWKNARQPRWVTSIAVVSCCYDHSQPWAHGLHYLPYISPQHLHLFPHD